MALSPQSMVPSGDAPRGKTDLGEILVEVGVISRDQLNQALAACKGSERDLAKTLVDLSFTTEEKIMKGIGIKAKVPYFTSLEGLYNPESANILSEELARRLQVVPLFKIDNVATIAMVNPLDVFTIDALIKTTNLKIDSVVCMRTTIFEAINKLYGGFEGGGFGGTSFGDGLTNGSAQTRPSNGAGVTPMSGNMPSQIVPDERHMHNIFQNLRSKMPESSMNQPELVRKEMDQGTEDMPIVQLVDAIFKQAVMKKASDIHIEPFTDHTEVRYRIDGVLRPVMTVPKEFENAMTARIKVMANLDITESRQPQDGRVMTEVMNRPVDLRISTLPIVHGEKTVIRILDKSAVEFSLNKLGFDEQNSLVFREALDRPNGIILVTGPTGSGKSTTLYTGLTILNSPDRNIVTLEDPVEYQLPRVNQVQVNPRVGLTFAKGLRSILRQDPDVVMVGEIRDQETGEIAIQAALTGHLVLSTLHTNDAPAAITRLKNMKIEPFLISASVILIIAQRLVRTLCPNCKKPFNPPQKSLDTINKGLGKIAENPTYFQPAGCEACNNTGYKGRKGLYEIMPMSTQLREMTVSNASTDVIRNTAVKEGMRTLFFQGATLAMTGQTSIEEMLRVCKIDD